MPTKSGRIKLEDVRQGKTVWLAFRLQPDEPYKPKPYMVAEGARLRFAGIKSDDKGVMRSYSLPAFAICPRYSGKDPSGLYKSVILSFFHPERNGNIREQSDGSFVHDRMAATRNSCQRLCDEINARVIVGTISHFQSTPGIAKYLHNFQPTFEPQPWEDK